MKYVISKIEQGHKFYIKSLDFPTRSMSVENEPELAKPFDTKELAEKYCRDNHLVPGLNGVAIEPLDTSAEQAAKQQDMSVEWQYQFMLKKLKLNEATMHQQQRVQMKEAFYAAWGQCLILQRDHIAAKPEMVGVMIIQLQLEETIQFWSDPTQHNA